MNYRLTPHATDRIAQRAIPADWFDVTLKEPSQIVDAAGGRTELRRVFERGGKRLLLRVICEGDVVVTALLTSKLAKYGVPES
ncbi:MAG TPA: hypothetical protein PLB41_14405 [Rubrivivax sp.]|nr:hypothetical protein [Rubrivivax sp.]HPO20257.1 hypothetical protein [Rubrivivax sp.]